MREQAAVSTEELSEQVMRLGRGLVGYAETRFSELGLTVPQAMLLRQLDQPLAMNAVAGRLHCDASNVTGIVDRLEARGLVERRVRRGDRRVKEIVITGDGRRLRGRIDEVVGGMPGVGSLSDDDRRTLARLLARAIDGLSREPETGG